MFARARVPVSLSKLPGGGRKPTKPGSGGTAAVPPTLSSAVIPSAGTSISLTFSESVSIGAGGNGGVSISMSGGASTLTYASGSGSTTLVYSLSRTVESGETGTVSYTQPGNGIEATGGGADVATFSAQSVTNNSTYTGGGAVLRDASNTGIVGAAISEGSLTNQGGITYNSSYNGQTITGKRFTSGVNLSGSNITIRGCLIETTAGSSAIAMNISGGTGNLIEDCTFRVNGGTGSVYMQVYVTGGSFTIRRCNISRGENNISINDAASNIIIEDSFLHDSSNASNPSGHRDCIEVYGGTNITIRRNTLIHVSEETSVINIAPWSGAASVEDLYVEDNYIDGGIMHIVYDRQSSGHIWRVRVVRNTMGGHTDPAVIGKYAALNNSDGAAIVQNEAALLASPTSILWPSSGADRNVWGYCVSNPFGYPNLSPNNTGNTVSP